MINVKVWCVSWQCGFSPIMSARWQWLMAD
jgi:hypothetical protein